MMSQDPLSEISSARRAAAQAALDVAFGGLRIDLIEPLSGGVSGAMLFLAQAGRRRLVLRLEGPAGPLRNPHQYIAMRIAAEAGLAPPIHYLNEEAGIAVMDFVDEQPLSGFPGGLPGLAHALGGMLRRLQALPAFPRFVDYPDIVARVWRHVDRSGVFSPGVLDRHTRKLDAIRSAYASYSERSVSSHNDVLPRNLLFDGERLWLIDWESAYRNDPLVDVATALDNFASTPDLEAGLLQGWYGGEPDRSARERLRLVRALTRLYYACVQFSAVASGEGAVLETDLSAPTVPGLQQMLRDGRLAPDTLETRFVLGKMLLAAFLDDSAWPGLPPPISQFQLKRDRSRA